MTEGDLYIHRDENYHLSSRLVAISRFTQGEVSVKTFTGMRNSTYETEEFHREFRVANKKDVSEVMDVVNHIFNMFTSHINDAISQYRDSKNIIDRLRDMAKDESIMSREEVLRQHLVSIAKEVPAINIGSNNAIRSIFNSLLRRDMSDDPSEVRGAIDLSSIRDFASLIHEDGPEF